MGLLTALTAVFIAVLAAPASAELKAGECSGSATFTDGTVIDQTTPESTVIVVPREDTVRYAGEAKRAAADADKEIGFSGGVAAKIGPVWVGITGWSGNAQPGEDSASGSYTYEVPGIVPGTGDIKVRANHKHGSADECVGVWTVRLDGGPGVVGIVAAAGTALFGVILLSAGITKGVKPS